MNLIEYSTKFWNSIALNYFWDLKKYCLLNSSTNLSYVITTPSLISSTWDFYCLKASPVSLNIVYVNLSSFVHLSMSYSSWISVIQASATVCLWVLLKVRNCWSVKSRFVQLIHSTGAVGWDIREIAFVNCLVISPINWTSVGCTPSWNTGGGSGISSLSLLKWSASFSLTA